MQLTAKELVTKEKSKFSNEDNVLINEIANFLNGTKAAIKKRGKR